MPKSDQAAPTNTLLAPIGPSKEADQVSTLDKEKELAKEKAFGPVNPLLEPMESSKEKRVAQSQVLVLANFPFTTKKDLIDKGVAQAIVLDPFAQMY
nr:hypothetical protein CFP56_69942 [Quercus suber]